MLSELTESELLVQGWRLIMNDDTTNSATNDELESEEMLEEYDFSGAKPGRYRGRFKGTFVRVLADGTEQTILPKQISKLKP